MAQLRRLLPIASWIGLALSLLALIESAPRLLEEGGGIGMVLGNVAKFGWTLALLLLVFGWTRTIGTRALVGAALAGFFGIASLAVLIGKPLMLWLGPENTFVPVVFAPVTEELLKLLPVAMFLLLAMRNPRSRPSVADVVLFGVTVAAGFTVYENILYARGTDGGWLTRMPISILLPFVTSHGPMLVGTHFVYAGLASLALGVTVIYGKQFRLARFALPIALLITMTEHATVNRIPMGYAGEALPLWVQLTLVITLSGYLSTLLLLIGVAAIAVYETRIIRRGSEMLPSALGPRDVINGLRGSPKLASLLQLHRGLRDESMRRSMILAAAQTGNSTPGAAAISAVEHPYNATGLAIGTTT